MVNNTGTGHLVHLPFGRKQSQKHALNEVNHKEHRKKVTKSFLMKEDNQVNVDMETRSIDRGGHKFH